MQRLYCIHGPILTLELWELDITSYNHFIVYLNISVQCVQGTEGKHCQQLLSRLAHQRATRKFQISRVFDACAFLQRSVFTLHHIVEERVKNSTAWLNLCVHLGKMSELILYLAYFVGNSILDCGILVGSPSIIWRATIPTIKQGLHTIYVQLWYYRNVPEDIPVLANIMAV